MAAYITSAQAAKILSCTSGALAARDYRGCTGAGESGREQGRMAGDIFDVVILNGRPAAGKSEVIDYLKQTPLEDKKMGVKS